MSKKESFFKQDSFLLGAAIGLLVPVITYILLDGLEYLAIDYIANRGGRVSIFGTVYSLTRDNILPDDTQMAIAVAGNLIFFRYYMVKVVRDKTGRGILMLTFLYAFLYILLFFMLDITRIPLF